MIDARYPNALVSLIGDLQVKKQAYRDDSLVNF